MGGKQENKAKDYLPFPLSTTLAQESRRVAVRLNTKDPGVESTGSAQK
jgi:hypothetical protein